MLTYWKPAGLFITNFSGWGHGRKADGTVRWMTDTNFKKHLLMEGEESNRGDKAPGKPSPDWPAGAGESAARFPGPSEHGPQQIRGLQRVSRRSVL